MVVVVRRSAPGRPRNRSRGHDDPFAMSCGDRVDSTKDGLGTEANRGAAGSPFALTTRDRELQVRVRFDRQRRLKFPSGVWGRADAIGVKTDLQSRTSGVEGIAVVPGGTSDRLFIARVRLQRWSLI